MVNFGSNTDVLIKVADKDGSSQLGDDYLAFLLEADDSNIELQRIEFVGPRLDQSLRDQGGLGMLVALGMILLYVAFRFQYKFALGAVAALAHDVVIILGFSQYVTGILI